MKAARSSETMETVCQTTVSHPRRHSIKGRSITQQNLN
jgi:hypothetical protein